MLLLNVTVAGNLASGRGGGLYTAGGNPTVRNTIIYGNRAQVSGSDMTVSGGVPYVAYSAVGGSMPENRWDAAFGTDGGGNTGIDPGYELSGFDANGHMRDGNYRLRSMGRSVVDGGYNNYLRIAYPVSVVLSSPVPRNTVYGDYLNRDLSGDARIIYENVDMGAYEHRSEPSLPVTVYGVEVTGVEGAETDPRPEVYYVRAHDSFTYRLTSREGYTLEHVTVVTGSTRHDEQDYTEITEDTDNAKTYVFHDITAPLRITVTGVTPAGVDGVAGGLSIWSSPGVLYVEAPSEGELRIYTLTGQLHTQRKIRAGRTSIALSPGMYIVATDGGRRQRVIVM
jgi:hypothetical protein